MGVSGTWNSRGSPAGRSWWRLTGRRGASSWSPTARAACTGCGSTGRLTDVHIERAGRGLRVTVGAQAHEVVVHRGTAPSGAAFEEGERVVSAPMSGVVTEVLVEEGSVVRQGDPLLVIVAMKMNNEIRAPLDGVVRSVHVRVGELTEHGALLVVLDAAGEPPD